MTPLVADADPDVDVDAGRFRHGALRLWRAGLHRLPIVLAIAMEAAWVSVVAGFVQELALRDPVIGVAGMAAFVTLGVVAARTLTTRVPDRWPALGTALVFAAGVVGLAISPSARETLGAGHLTDALARNPGGLFAALAVLRGYPHAGDRLSADTGGRAIFVGAPGLAIVAAIGGLVTEPWRSAFLRDAAIDAVIFVVAGLLTLAIAALMDVRPSGTTVPAWRANPVWVAMVVAAIAALLALAIPIGVLGGPAIAFTIEVVLAVSMLPLAVAGLVLEGRGALRRMAPIIGGTFLLIWILSFAPRGGGPDAGAGGSGPPSIEPILGPVGVIGISGASMLLIGLLVFLLIAAWMRRHAPLPDDLTDVRSRDLPGIDDGGPAARHHRRGLWTREPRTAAEAYVALVEALRETPDIRRAPAETPSEHARRLRLARLASDAGISLELLAADYGLAAYGERPLTKTETRRAIGRWRSLRRRLRVDPIRSDPNQPAADDDVALHRTDQSPQH